MCTKFEAKLWKFLRLLTTNQIAAVMFQNIPHTKAFLTLYQKRYARLQHQLLDEKPVHWTPLYTATFAPLLLSIIVLL